MQIQRDTKEILRHLILKSGLNRAWLALRAASGENVEHLRARALGERFSAIYQNRIWLNGRTDGSLSGLGSELENTRSIRVHLPKLLADLKTKTLIDVGCGDFNWMQDLSIDCDYVGVDVAQTVIDQNTRRYGTTTRSFITLDATKDPLPPADTALCREILFHLSFDDIRSLMQNLRGSGISTLIATHDVVTSFNADILSGDFRLLNLTKPPFRFPPPELFIPDDGVSPGRVLAAWTITVADGCFVSTSPVFHRGVLK